MRGQGEVCRSQGITLVPAVVESLGSCGEELIRVVRRLARALARHTGQEEKDVLRHQWGSLAISLQRGNAAILGNRIPTYPGLAIDGQY